MLELGVVARIRKRKLVFDRSREGYFFNRNGRERRENNNYTINHYCFVRIQVGDTYVYYIIVYDRHDDIIIIIPDGMQSSVIAVYA